jgi:hypothetical protein
MYPQLFPYARLTMSASCAVVLTAVTDDQTAILRPAVPPYVNSSCQPSRRVHQFRGSHADVRVEA